MKELKLSSPLNIQRCGSILEICTGGRNED